MKVETIIRNLEEILQCPQLTTEQCFAVAGAIDKLKKKVAKKIVSEQLSSGESNSVHIIQTYERVEGNE